MPQIASQIVDPAGHPIEMASRNLNQTGSPTQPSPLAAVEFGREDKKANRNRSRRIRSQTPLVVFQPPVECGADRFNGYVVRRPERLMRFCIRTVRLPVRDRWRRAADHQRRINHHDCIHPMVQLHQEPGGFERHDSADAVPRQPVGPRWLLRQNCRQPIGRHGFDRRRNRLAARSMRSDRYERKFRSQLSTKVLDIESSPRPVAMEKKQRRRAI